MTDNEIIEALERCPQHRECCYCNSVEECGSKKVLVASVLDLINQQKTQIEKLESIEHFAGKLIEAQRAEIELFIGINKLLERNVQTSKTEGIKEFTASFKALFKEYSSYDTLHIYEILDRVDIIEETMTEEQND